MLTPCHPPSRMGKAMPRSASFVGYSRMIAAAAATALLCLAVPAEAGCSKSVIMYNASWCPYCRQVRAILARNHIRYSILDATTPQVQAVMLKRFGDTAVPRTIIGGVLVEGVDEARIRQLCR
jgi:glutaredoxin